MNNKEFITALSERTNMQQRTTQQLVGSLIGIITTCLEEDNIVVLPQLGSFEVRKKQERVIINPTTKQKMLVPPKLVVGFRPAQMLKDKMK